MIIHFHSVKKEFFSKVIFSGIRNKIPITAGQKIGIVAKNGEGKTTLLRMIAGIESLDVGAIKIEPKKTRKFYMSVDQINEYESTTEEFLLSINLYLYSLKLQMRELEKDLADETNYAKYSEIYEKYEKAGGFTWDERVEKFLHKLNLADKTVKTLSGGEKSRLILASIQLIDADLILLDEPTNHLDLPALKELEDYIKSDKKSYLIVSHDQKFLDNVVTQIISIHNRRIKIYNGNYSAFKLQKADEEKQALEEYKANAHEIERLEKMATSLNERLDKGMLISRNSVNAGGKRVTNHQGRNRKVTRDNDKMAVGYFNERIESHKKGVTVIKNRIEKINLGYKPKKDWGIKINLESNQDVPDIIVRTKNLSVNLGERLFNFPDITILKHERVAVIGPNGVGKSTLAKIITGEIKNYSGEVKVPESVTIGYYSQTHESLKLKKNVIENLLDLEKIDDYDTPAIKDARNFLHHMLFTGDNTSQKVGDLSQGERSKLVLAKIIYSNPNFLLWDEPTNHLDIPSKERLEEALSQYKGTILVISHDRYFMESIGIERYVEIN